MQWLPISLLRERDAEVRASSARCAVIAAFVAPGWRVQAPGPPLVFLEEPWSLLVSSGAWTRLLEVATGLTWMLHTLRLEFSLLCCEGRSPPTPYRHPQPPPPPPLWQEVD